MQINDLIATFFYSGKSPKMPGTMGTFAALITSIPLLFFDKNFAFICFVISIITLVIGVKSADIYSKKVKNSDPKEVVIDEVCGYYISITIFFFICGNFCEKQQFSSLLLNFFMFRFFDIIKPFPISYIDKNTKGGIGIMLDDVIAGIFSSITSIMAIKILY
ncbi:phosphatidylglycerophosphatase A family protein [Candidatus Deianiraea vastatrix]|uniref:Phosphatidylglycerophosphatase A n=1 Tax=Candidatus Deianiraea vastatrix TaxID=2163644 RepID=A0A5B8XFW5_9RICK|nr:phosphatidylglycerophosphatase A [Candidatus Deianiraea vastatrix]QED23151.1 Phosphatidylglycerophosphatase A [Candidatus Deianiraea vastatrix]